MKNYEWITFDCYGTLIEWESGTAETFQKVARTSGTAIDRSQVLKLYAKYEAEEELTYKTYVDVLTRVARRISLELRLRTQTYTFLAESLPRWRPFPDTNAALQRLARKHRLGILSNVDNHLLAETRKHFGVPFELIITAENVASYKPSLQHFQEARRKVGNATWIHAAQSHFHDLVPCSRLGIDCAWINRNQEINQEPQKVQPVVTCRDLVAFANWLEDVE